MYIVIAFAGAWPFGQGLPPQKPIVVSPPVKIQVERPHMCAIPLTNVLKGQKWSFDRMVVSPPPFVRRAVPHPAEVIRPPAPPCDDVK